MLSSLFLIHLAVFLSHVDCSNLNKTSVKFNRTVNIFTEYKPLVYSFDVSILKRALNETHIALSDFCNNEIKYYETLLNRKLSDILTMEYILDSGVELENSISRNTFSSLNYLNSDLAEFSSALNIQKCEIYKKLASDFTRIYFYIDRFSRGNYSLLDEVIDFQYLKNDTEKLSREFHPRNITFPINFKNTLEGDFFSHVKFRIQFHKDFLFLIFKIPFYEKIDIYTVSNEETFIAFNRSKPINFSLKKLDETCYYTKREFFCEKPELKYRITDELNLLCFQKTFLNNMSNEFNNDLIIIPTILGLVIFSFVIFLTVIKCMNINVRLSFSEGIVFYTSV